MHSMGSWLTARVAEALADLAEHLQDPDSEIEVVRAERVTWPDASVGCPQPGMRYTQALVPGYFIQLRAAGRIWNYHGGRGTPRLCDSPAERLPEDLPDAHRDL